MPLFDGNKGISQAKRTSENIRRHGTFNVAALRQAAVKTTRRRTPVRLTGRKRAAAGEGARRVRDRGGERSLSTLVFVLRRRTPVYIPPPANFTWFIFSVVSGASRNFHPLSPSRSPASSSARPLSFSLSRIFIGMIHPAAIAPPTFVFRTPPPSSIIFVVRVVL